ncbi:hypothetical protein VCR14J2_270030 [Vibrio coralliirubri]|nr:hypothetical protein VCR14J2_270030 [Vibrio coralliirubri]
MLLMYYRLCGYCIVPTTCWCLSVIARNSQMSKDKLAIQSEREPPIKISNVVNNAIGIDLLPFLSIKANPLDERASRV